MNRSDQIDRAIQIFQDCDPADSERAQKFLTALHSAGAAFHPEDRGEQIIDHRTGEPLFTDHQLAAVRSALDWIYDTPDQPDPCEILLDLEKETTDA